MCIEGVASPAESRNKLIMQRRPAYTPALNSLSLTLHLFTIKTMSIGR